MLGNCVLIEEFTVYFLECKSYFSHMHAPMIALCCGEVSYSYLQQFHLQWFLRYELMSSLNFGKVHME